MAENQMASSEQSSNGNQGNANGEQRRKELADFLRNRREKLKPEQVGLAQGARRRTPGLRREEVAEIAGVGTTWYTWLEQARDIQPSGEVLRRLGQALRLSPAEMRHLFALAGKAMPSDLEAQDESVSESLHRILNQALNVPAILVGGRWDILALNAQAKDFFPSLANFEVGQKNWMYHLFCGPDERQRVVNWEESAKRMVAEFRSAVSETLDNPWVLEVVEKLKFESVEFDQWWREHDIRDHSSTMIEMIDAVGKRVRVERSALKPWQNPRLRILVFTPLSEN